MRATAEATISQKLEGFCATGKITVFLKKRIEIYSQVIDSSVLHRTFEWRCKKGEQK